MVQPVVRLSGSWVDEAFAKSFAGLQKKADESRSEDSRGTPQPSMDIEGC